MKRKRFFPLLLAAIIIILTTSAFALDESEVQSAIAASSKTEVSGNLFIWLLCAVAFLKISQKIDSFLAGIGVNVGRTGGSMLGELLIAGRAIGAAAGGVGGAVGNFFTKGHSSTTNNTQAAGTAFTGGGSGLAGIAMRAVGNAAAASATGRGSGLGSVIGGAAYAASAKSRGTFATDVVSAVATGNIAKVGSMTGDRASNALSSYLGYNTPSVAATPVSGGQGENIPITPDIEPDGNSIPRAPSGSSVVTEDGGYVAGAEAAGAAGTEPSGSGTIPSQPPVFSDVEIGGGRITGYESPAEGGEARQFAMYHAGQYMEPAEPYEKVQSVDGESWYKQYAQPTVQKTPYQDGTGKIQYHEEIVPKMPQIPKRKDKV